MVATATPVAVIVLPATAAAPAAEHPPSAAEQRPEQEASQAAQCCLTPGRARRLARRLAWDWARLLARGLAGWHAFGSSRAKQTVATLLTESSPR